MVKKNTLKGIEDPVYGGFEFVGHAILIALLIMLGISMIGCNKFKEGDLVELTIVDCAWIGQPPKYTYKVTKQDGQVLIGPYIYKHCIEYYSPKLIKKSDNLK